MIPFAIGQEHRVTARITADDVARFAALSGDDSPLHFDAAFAQRHGFAGPLVHGALLFARVSQLVGVGLPGPNSVLERCDLAFRAPCYAPCEIELVARVRQISEAVGSLLIDVTIVDAAGQLLASGKTWHRILESNSSR